MTLSDQIRAFERFLRDLPGPLSSEDRRALDSLYDELCDLLEQAARDDDEKTT